MERKTHKYPENTQISRKHINIQNNNIYLLQLGCYPVAVVILHVNKTHKYPENTSNKI